MCSIFTRLTLLFFVLVLTPACAQGSCTCPGQRVDNFAGGNGKPLEWQFEVYLIKEGDNRAPPLYCYLKAVSNRSGHDVYAVKWDIANYQRDIVPSNETLPTCPQYLQIWRHRQ